MATYAVATNPGVVPWLVPTAAGAGGAVAISSQQLDDYAITTSEEATASCSVTGSPTAVTVVIAGKSIALTNTSGSSWSGIVQGNYIGQVTNETVLFLAGDSSNSDSAVAGSNITITMSTVKVNPDPLDTTFQMMKADWIMASTDSILPNFIALVDGRDVDSYRGTKKFDFQNDTVVMYELTETETAKGTGFENINRIDSVTIDVHTPGRAVEMVGPRAHFRKVIDMIRYIIYKNRKHPTTYPSNADKPYDLLDFIGEAQEFSDKYSGHHRMVFTIRLRNFWELIDQ